MNYEVLAKTLFVRKKFSRSVWKSEVVIINAGAGFSNSSWYLEFSGSEVSKTKNKCAYHDLSIITMGTIYFFSHRYNEVK